MRKPVSIWFLQIILSIVAVLCLIGAAGGIAAWLKRPGAPDLQSVAVLISSLIRLAVAVLAVWTIVAAQRRSSIARWLAALLLGGTVVISVLATAKAPAAMIEQGAPTIFGYYLGVTLVLAPVALILWFSTLSKRARAWFATAQ
jgi:hypothetical protein